jgi:squalene synthase HpnC
VTSPVHGVEHYENFPVASWLMPARLRPAVVAIYRFARHADDVADEGDAPAAERLAALRALREDLVLARAGQPVRVPVVAQLVPHVRAHGLDWSRFDALLSAFEQDVTVHRYPDFETLIDYCRRSADPVGQLVLALSGHLDDTTRAASDRICSALQLINFLQDAAIDWSRGRIYLPLDALARHGVGETELARAAAERRAGPALRACIAAEARRASELLAGGAGLPARVGGRLGWELRAIVAGGARILERLAASGHDPFVARPVLSRRDALPLAGAMLRLAIDSPALPPAPAPVTASRPEPR